MLKVALATIKDEREYRTGGLYEEPILITQPIHTFEGVFKTTTHTVAGTSTVAEPLPKSSLLLTDLVLTTDKVALSTVTISFTDGVNTINILTANTSDAPVNLSIPFAGRWQGWKDAKIELTTVNNVTATVACGYMKIEEKYTLAFDDWDSRR